MLTLDEGLTRLWLDGGEWAEWARHQLHEAEKFESNIYATIEEAMKHYDEERIDAEEALDRIAQAAGIESDPFGGL